jgi:hypothetical protein
MNGVIPPLPQYVFMAWRLVEHRDNFTFYLYLYLCVTEKWKREVHRKFPYFFFFVGKNQNEQNGSIFRIPGGHSPKAPRLAAFYS